MKLPIDQIPLSVIILKKELSSYSIVQMNSQALIDEALEAKEVYGRDISAVFPNLNNTILHKTLDEVMQNAKPKELELNIFEDKPIDGWRYLYISQCSEDDTLIIQYKNLTKEKLKERSKISPSRYLEEAQAIAHMGNWSWNIVDNTIYWSDEIYRIFGETPQSFTPTFEHFISYLDKEDAAALESTIQDSIKKAKPYVYSHKIYRKDGSIRYAKASGYVRYNTQNHPIELIGSTIDITELYEVKQELTLLAQAIEQMHELVRITNKEGELTYVNEALLRFSGYSEHELIGKTNAIFKSGMHNQAFYKELWRSILQGRVYKNIITNKIKDGSIVFEEMTITPIFIADEITYFVATSHDITQRKHLEESLKQLAMHDSLTGLYNRYYMQKELDKQLERLHRYNTPFSLLMLDLDHFKKINDTYGHDIGDKVLILFSDTINRNIRKNDIFGRWGGEEFLIILPETAPKQAEEMAHKLSKLINDTHFEEVTQVTMSVGLTKAKQEDTKAQLLKRVDEAMYRAKRKGRNCYITL